MVRRLVVVAVFSLSAIPPSLAQTTEDPSRQAPIESPPPPPEAIGESRALVSGPSLAQMNAAMALGESRGAVRLNPDDPAHRLALASALYRLGDLEAASEECRAAIKLQPNDAKAHLQLGVIFIAKQDWRGAASVLHEAVRLDPGLADAHYSLGAVHYSLGRVNAAVQSYRQALTLQPYLPDAQFRLALLLKLSKQEPEAARLMEEAALGGVAQAQFFLGNAYKSGQGVEKDFAKAVFWWSKAAEYGYQPSTEVLGKLRRQALSLEQPARKRQEAHDAFVMYRRRLWEEFPEYSPADDEETVGIKLLRDRRAEAAVPMLLKEAYALSEAAEVELARLYEQGSEHVLPPHEKKILACFEATAADGFLPAKRTLARIYGKGIGVTADVPKAKTLLKGLPRPEAAALSAEFAGR